MLKSFLLEYIQLMKMHLSRYKKKLMPHMVFLPVLILVISLGIVSIHFSHAASAFVSSEAESGTLSGSATVVTASGTSGGKYVAFGSASSPSSSGLFPSSNFDKPVIQSMALSPNSSTYVNDFVNDYKNNYGAVAVNELPIFTVPANQPMIPVGVNSGCGNFTPSTGTSIPIPVSAYTTSATYQNDSAMIIYQPSTNSDWELWQATKSSSGSWSACWGGKLSPSTSNGVFPNGYGLSGSGISYLALTITENDIASGAINHAIAVDLPACNGPQVLPADRTDCGSDPGQPPEGTMYRFPSSLTMPSGLTPFGQMVFTAIQKYGMVQTDQAGAVALQAETTQDWTTEGHTGTDPITQSWAGEQEYQVVANLPWSDMQVVQPPSSW